MAFYDLVGPAQGASLQGQRSFGTVLRRSAEWTKEIPGLISGLAKLAAPFKWHLAVIFAFNVVIALWETIQPFILAWGVDTFGANAPYLQIVAIIVFPMLAISVPHGIVLPLARDLYAAWFVKPQFEKHVGLLCLARDRSPQRTADPELLSRKAPVAQEGRDAAYQLIDKLLRDPAFAFRGLVVMAVLTVKSPALLALLCVGILADLWVTLLMDARLFAPYAAQQAHQFRVRGLEYALLDNKSLPARSFARSQDLTACEREWDEYVAATRFAETRRIFYQLPIREGISLVVRIGCMMMVGWWVHIGQVSIGEYILFTQLAGRANDPLYVFFGMQQQIMTTRESLRRLGLLCGIDFAIRRPAHIANA
jgi:ABC-type multidrug transport system fused ATPase/permease subunit